jgi:hypothetical protein
MAEHSNIHNKAIDFILTHCMKIHICGSLDRMALYKNAE